MIQLHGIPGTVSEATKHIRWYRGKDTSTGERRYTADVPDGQLVAVVSQDMVTVGKSLWHISISHHDKEGAPDRCPTWEELKHARYQLIQADVPMVLIFPRRTAPYVDIYPTCLHLWETDDKGIDL